MVHETNTTEIPHVGTYAGHTGHRLRGPLWWKGYRPRVRPLCGSPKVPSVHVYMTGRVHALMPATHLQMSGRPMSTPSSVPGLGMAYLTPTCGATCSTCGRRACQATTPHDDHVCFAKPCASSKSLWSLRVNLVANAGQPYKGGCLFWVDTVFPILLALKCPVVSRRVATAQLKSKACRGFVMLLSCTCYF